jgi:hypothetical protein
MTKKSLERIVSVLNQYCRCDPRAVRAVFEFRHSINSSIKDTDIIARNEAGVETISALGVINSCLESRWRIAVDTDESNPEPFSVVVMTSGEPSVR